MTVKLYTRNGGFVTEATIPPFIEAPDVVLWGNRVFTYYEAVPDGWYRYNEVFCYAIPVVVAPRSSSWTEADRERALSQPEDLDE